MLWQKHGRGRTARKFTATGLLLLFLFSLQMAMIEPYQPEDSVDPLLQMRLQLASQQQYQLVHSQMEQLRR